AHTAAVYFENVTLVGAPINRRARLEPHPLPGTEHTQNILESPLHASRRLRQPCSAFTKLPSGVHSRTRRPHIQQQSGSAIRRQSVVLSHDDFQDPFDVFFAVVIDLDASSPALAHDPHLRSQALLQSLFNLLQKRVLRSPRRGAPWTRGLTSRPARILFDGSHRPAVFNDTA